jgi:hypothetical protein
MTAPVLQLEECRKVALAVRCDPQRGESEMVGW